ncbi:uncharacterized protein LOC144665335 [Oculina patagonica]
MAENSAKVANMARVLAIVHIVVGSILICFGIADRAMQYYWTGYGCYGIWMGVWMCIAGGLGIPGTRKERTTSRNAFAGVFMGFSITSAVFGGAIIVIYSIGIATYRDSWYYYYNDDYYRHRDYEYGTEAYWRRRYGPTEDYYYSGRDHRYDTEMALCAVILILGIVEFATGIWAAVCLCLMKPCTCCYGTPPQQGQMMYTANPGYAMTPFPVGVPAAVPLQADGGMVTMQTVIPGAQAGQPQMVVIPVSGGVSTQSHLVEVAAPSNMTATVYQPPQVEIPQSSRHGGYMRLTNEQDPVAI